MLSDAISSVFGAIQGAGGAVTGTIGAGLTGALDFSKFIIEQGADIAGAALKNLPPEVALAGFSAAGVLPKPSKPGPSAPPQVTTTIAGFAPGAPSVPTSSIAPGLLAQALAGQGGSTNAAIQDIMAQVAAQASAAATAKAGATFEDLRAQVDALQGQLTTVGTKPTKPTAPGVAPDNIETRAREPADSKKGLPVWAWVAIGTGALLVVGVTVYLIARR